jgi:WD40 repeat protein
MSSTIKTKLAKPTESIKVLLRSKGELGHRGAPLDLIIRKDPGISDNRIRILTTSKDAQCIEWDSILSGEEVGSKIASFYSGHSDWVTSIASISEYGRFATCSYDKTVKIWKLTDCSNIDYESMVSQHYSPIASVQKHSDAITVNA